MKYVFKIYIVIKKFRTIQEEMKWMVIINFALKVDSSNSNNVNYL